MKNKLKQLLSIIKENDFARIIIELIFLVSLFNINQYIGLGILLILILEILFSRKNENLLCIYLFLSFFDEILILDIIKGSVSRIVMVFIFFKLFIYILKNKILPNKLQLSIILFFLISFFVGIFSNGFNTESVVVLANIYMFILFSMTIKPITKEEKNKFIEKLCFTIVYAIMGSIVYGCITNNFLEQIVDYEKQSKIYRFNGTYEPNFMCMYINLGILSLLTIKDKFKKFIYYIFISIMINFAILTASITGIVTLAISLFIYLVINFKRKTLNYLSAIIIIGLSIFMFFGIKFIINQMNINNYFEIKDELNLKDEKPNKADTEEKEEDNQVGDSSLTQRINRIIKQIKNGKLDDVTSGRLPLIKIFVKASFNRPILNILFGNGVTNKKIYTSFFNKDCYSHNSYADFLYNFGVIGFLLIIIYITYKTQKNKILNFYTQDTKYASNIKIIRIMLVLYALSLTLYTKRMFLIFFLL